MNDMLVGAIATLSLVAAVYFLRFWRETRDRFFLLFAIALGIEALVRPMISLTVGLKEAAPQFYIIRLLSFGLIIIAIVDKNLSSRK